MGIELAKIDDLATQSVRADYEAMLGQVGASDTDMNYKMFCAGVVMAMLTAEGFSEDPNLRFSNGPARDSMMAYFNAANRKINAN